MAQPNAYRDFGDRVRSLRKACGYTLQEVARATEDVVKDSRSCFDLGAEAIFTPNYLSQVESGRPINLPLAKLMVLASVLGVGVHELIAALPTDARLQRLRDIDNWAAAKRRFPSPLRRLPADQRVAERRVDALLTATADGVMIPMQDEAEVRAEMRKFVLMAILPAQLAQETELAEAFWSDRADSVIRRLDLYIFPQWGVAEDYVDWCMHERLCISDAFAQVSSWSYNYSKRIGSCTFRDELLLEWATLRNTPGPVAEAIGLERLARLLARSGSVPSELREHMSCGTNASFLPTLITFFSDWAPSGVEVDTLLDVWALIRPLVRGDNTPPTEDAAAIANGMAPLLEYAAEPALGVPPRSQRRDQQSARQAKTDQAKPRRRKR